MPNYYVTIMAKCTCAWLHQLLKLLTSAIFGHVLIQVKQDGFMLRLICIFLGCDLPIQLLLKSLSRTYHDRLVDHFTVYWFMSWTTNYVIFYTWTNRLTCCSTCSLPTYLLLCVNINVNKHLTTNIIKYILVWTIDIPEIIPYSGKFSEGEFFGNFRKK